MQIQSLPTAAVLSPPERFTPRSVRPPAPLLGGAVGALNVLIVEDDEVMRGACAGIAGSLGCHVRTAHSVAAARLLLAEASVDVVFLYMRLPGGSGDSLLEEIRATHPRTFVVIMTAYATVTSAVELMRNGAGNFLQKPFALDQVSAVLHEVAKRRQGSEANRALQDRLQAGLAAGRLIGESAAMQKLFRILPKVAFTHHPVLITGERGTGKEVLARAIHANGPHALSPFIPVDCDSLEPSRLEAELFGYEQTAEAGGRRRIGLLASAGHGTVYLAEIGSLEPPTQAKLLRALQERQIRPAGGSAPVPLEARVLASSSCDLEFLVGEGRFRRDLFYRLNIAKLSVPPLRDRPEDIPLLVEHFLDRQRRERNLPYALTDEALESIMNYPFAGNLEELEALIEHACAFSSGSLLHFGDLSPQVQNYVQASTAESLPEDAGAAENSPLLPLHLLEKQAIQMTLKQLKGDKLLAAKHLGIGKTTLYRKLKEYGIGDDGS